MLFATSKHSDNPGLNEAPLAGAASATRVSPYRTALVRQTARTPASEALAGVGVNLLRVFLLRHRFFLRCSGR